MSSNNMDILEDVFTTIANSSLEELEKYLQNGGSPNLKSIKDFSLIHMAVKEKYEEKIELLIKHDCDINATDADGWRPLNVAINASDERILKILLEAKAEVNYVTISYSQTNPLMQAVLLGNLDMVSLIVDKGENCDVNFINDKGNFSGQSALSQAIMRREIDICQYLFNCGASYKMVSESRYKHQSQRTVFTICKHDELMKLFLINDIDLNLHYHLKDACKYGHHAVAEMILTKLDDPFQLDAVGLIARQGKDDMWERFAKAFVKPYSLATKCCKENVFLSALLSFCELNNNKQRQTLRNRAIELIRVLRKHGLAIHEQTRVRNCHSDCECRKAIFVALRDFDSQVTLKDQCCSVIRQNMTSKNNEFDLDAVNDLPLPTPFKDIICMKDW